MCLCVCKCHHSQTVHYSASLSSVVLLLPLVHLSDEFEEGALGHGCVAVHGPAQELELLHHPIAVLRLHSKHTKHGPVRSTHTHIRQRDLSEEAVKCCNSLCIKINVIG